MLEIRYNKQTSEITGWWGSRYGNHEVKLKNRPDEVIIMLDIPIPDKPLGAWLFDNGKLISNPSYIKPELPRDLVAELDDLKVKVENPEKA
ncbi:hypothetical protein ES703_66933 [subsurface metagenome]